MKAVYRAWWVTSLNSPSHRASAPSSPGIAAVTGGEAESRRDPPGRVALTAADRVAAALEPDEGTVAGGDPGHRCHLARGATGLLEQGPFELAGQLRPVDRAVTAADEGSVALADQRWHAGLVVEP